MKKILAILMFAAAFGMLMGSVSAALDMHEHDFDGKCTVNLPDEHWIGDQVPFGKAISGGGITVHYFNSNQLQGTSLDDYISSQQYNKVGTEGNLTIYQSGSKYVVLTNSTDDYLLVTDKNLDEAKKIASSADFKGTDATAALKDNSTSSNSSNSTGDLEKTKVDDILTINAPKGADFGNSSFDGFWAIYSPSNCDAVLYYTFDDLANVKIDDNYYNSFIKNITSNKIVDSYVDGDVTVVKGLQNIDGTIGAYVHQDNKMAIVISNDENLAKEMAKSIEFTK
ncbi:MAG: hypothetical protein ABS871_02260 [Methanobrevibacter sp.]